MSSLPSFHHLIVMKERQTPYNTCVTSSITHTTDISSCSHQKEVSALMAKHGVVLLRGFSIATPHVCHNSPAH